MRIEPGSLKPCSTELTPECSEYISRLRRQENASLVDFATNLEKMTEWSSVLGKTEMSRWVHVLNDCDLILEQATMLQANGAPAIDNGEALERPVMAILKFTCLLFESTFSRSVYRSMERLQTLLESRKMHVVVQTLRLLLVISKSSRYITHHVAEADRRPLQMRLIANTEESWNAGGKWKLKMADLCVDGALLDGEAHLAEMRTIGFRTAAGTSQQFIAGEDTSYEEAKGELRKRLDELGDVEESEKVLAMTKLRLAYNFNSLDLRLHCIMARLISISVLFYSRCLLDEWRINCLVGDSMIEQICALLQLPSGDATNAALIDTLKTEALKTLASVVFLEKQTKIQLIVDCLGLNSYHGSTPALVRSCVEKLKNNAVEPEGGRDDDGSGPSVNFITSLFSLVYHLAGFEAGGSALTRSSMVATLLGVVKAYSLPDSQISFVTRAVRIIDILTGIEVQEFNTNDGMSAIVDRFVHEVDVCKKHIEKEEELKASSDGGAASLVVCHQQRAALMKSLMNFLKRAVADTNYATQIRRIMECELPTALAHLVQNSQYYGASLLHCAIHLTTSFIYQEPAQLTHLQDKGLTDALLDSILLNEKFPISRDIVNALPNICSALCLNERGLKAFNEKQPLERIFRIIFSTKFLASMRKRKTEIQECATSLGSTFDELMRHQPTLRKDLISALVIVVDDILATGMKGDTPQPNSSSSTAPAPAPARIVWTVGKNVPEESFDVEGGEKKSPAAQVSPPSTFQFYFQAADGTQILPLADYAVMLGYLVDFILNNRAAQENSNLMVEAGMQNRLVEFLNFPRPYSTVQQWHYLQSVSNILRHLLSQTNKTEALEPLVTKLTQQLQLYSRASTVQEVHTRERHYLLNRIGPMVAVLHNYLLKATGVNNVHDTRALLLSYFTGSETGKEFINQLFECYADMNWDMLLVASATDASAPPPPPISTPSQTPSAAGHLIPQSSSGASTPIDAPSTLGDVAQPSALTTPNNAKRSTSGESSLERNINSSTNKIQKHIGELIYLLGRTFCFTAINRLRRGVGLLDPAQCKSVQRQMAETLFVGMGRLMVIDEENLRGNGSGVHIANVLGLLKRLLFDDVQGHHFMRPFFLKSHCHRAFFALGEWLIDNMAREELAAGLASWLSMVPRLVSASSVVQQPRARMEQRSVVEGFDYKKYLSVTHRDALHTLVQLFKSATAQSTAGERRGDGAKVMVEKVLMALQSLVRGMIQINETEKKANAEPDLDVLLREIDMDKVQRLVEMGFSQSDAVDALLVHNSVPEAAEYLMDRQGQASTAVSASSTSSATAAIRSAQVITFNSTDALSAPTAAITAEAVTAALAEPTEPTITLREVLAHSTFESIDGVPIQRQSSQPLEPSSSSASAVSEAAPVTAEPSTIQGESTQPPLNPPLDVSTPATDEPPTTVGISAEAMDTSEPSEHQPPVNPSTPAATSSSQQESQPVTDAVSQPSSSKTLAPSSADDFSQTLEELREAKAVDFKEAIEQICSGVVPHCLALGHDETLVYAIAELIYVFVGDPVALALVEKTLIDGLITDLHAGLNGLLQSPKEGECRFRSLLHLFCLLWQGFETTKLYSKLPPTFYPSIVELLVKLAAEENSLESRLIPHLVLFIDMYEKERRLDHRQQLFNTCVDHIQWCYHVNEQRYDSPAEWRDYPAICSAQLNQAFRDGKAVVKITMSEKNYLVNFVDMTQRLINTGDVPALVRAVPVFAKAKLSPTFQLEKVLESEQTLNDASEEHKQLAAVVTRLLQQTSKSNTPLPSQTAYSLLSLLLRLLSLRGTVSDFIKNDGIATLLKLECKERMFIMSRIVVLIARLCADDDNEAVLASFEQIVQSAVSSSTVPFQFSLTEPSSQARGWMQRTRRQQREWKVMMRMFAPLAVRAPKLHVETIKKTVCLRNDEMALESTSAASLTERVQHATESQDTLKKIVGKIVDELLHTNWAKTKSRVLGLPELLKLLAELVRSYPSTSTQLVEAVHEKRPLVHWIIDRFLLQNYGVPGDTTVNGGRWAVEEMADVSLSAKALLSNMISCSAQSNAKANEVLVGEVKSLLHSTINTHQQRRRDAGGKQASAAENKEAIQQLCYKVTSLAKLLMLLRESASNAVSTPSADNPQRREMPKQYALIKQIHKKALVVDFTKALWHLPLREKVAAETTNCVLRMLETIARDLCHITAVSRAAAAASATNTAPNATSSATPAATPASSSSAPSVAEGTVNAVTPLVGNVETADSEAPTAPAPFTNPVAVSAETSGIGDEPLPQAETGNTEQAQQNEEDVEMAEFSEHVSEAISTINAATSGDLPSAVREGAFDRVDEDMGVPPAAEEAHHSHAASTPRYEIYEDDHEPMGDDHANHSDHEDHADAYSSASSPSSSSSDEGSAGEGVGGGDVMNAPEHVSDEDDTVSEEDDEVEGANDAHMEIDVIAEIGAGAVVDGDVAVPIRSRHPAGDIHTVHDPIRIDQVRMEEEDDEEEDDGAEEDDEAMEADSRVITRVVNPHHHHHVAHDEHDDPEDEVDEDDEEEGDEEDGEEDDDEGEDGMDYDDDEAEMDLEEVLDGLGADQLVSELQRRTGRHASTHLGNLAGYVSGLLGRLPGGASAVLEAAAADGRHRHRLFTLSHNNRDGPSATAGFSVGIPLDRYRFSAAATAAMGGAPTGISRGDGAMSEHPLLRRPLPPISIPLPGATGGGDSSHSPSNDNAQQQQQQLAVADQAAVHLANSNYPMSLMEFLQNDEAIQRIVAAHTGRVHRPAAVHGGGLRRQGALRRWHPIAVPADPHNPNAPHGMHASRVTHRLLARIMDEGYDQLYGGNRDAVAAGYGDAEGLEASTDRRLTDSIIPYYYDRVADHVRLVEAQSAHYLSILISSHLTNEAREKERRVAEEEAKKKQEAEEARKKVAEEARKKAEEEARKAAEEASATAAAAAAESEQTANASDAAGVEVEGEQPAAAASTEPSSASAPPPPTSNSSGGENGEEDERHSAGESVDSSELSNRFAVLPTSAAEDESTRDSGRDGDIEQPPVVQQLEEDPATPQAQVSAMEVELEEQQPIVEENPTQPLPQPQQPAAEEGSTEAVAVGEDTGEPSTAEDYRAILGNIEIPEGVDPAFLAALPEEIRQEVIRDHMRQQRAQRLVQAQRAASTQSAAEGSTQSINPQPDNTTPQQNETPQEVSDAPVQGGPQQQPAQPAAAANEDEEVLDQEFLNALPPELQEEVLREHEQRITQRNRQAAAAAAATSGSATAAPAAVPTAADHAADAAALFESLPPGLRAQVLADMDDSIVAYLPPNLQAEANRLRANLHHQQAFRIAMGGGGGGEHRGAGNRFGGTATAVRGGGASRFYDGQMYAQPGAAQLGDVERGVQTLDREAIATVLLVYFFDQERFNHTRLQKLLKVICLHSGTCDYVVWSLLSILHGLNNDKGGDESSDASAATGWVDTQFLVQTPLNHSERIIRFLASGEVSIHPLVKQSICTRVLDVLGQVMARNFPQHFLPDKIRLAPNSTKRWDSPPEIAHFWATVKSINKKSGEESKPVSAKSTCQGMKDMIAGSLEKSPLAHLLTLPSSPLIRQNGTLMDKSVKILQTIAQSIPNGSQAKVPDESIHWLMERIKGVANLMLESCTEGDGLEGVKGFLFEVLRMLPEHRATLFSILYTIVEEQGARLHCDLLALSDELKELKPKLSVGSTTAVEAVGAPSTSSASDAPPAPTSAHQLSTLKDFTARNSQAKRLLRSVEVISYLRNKQRQLDQQRKRALAAVAAASKDKEKGGAAQPPSTSIAQQQDAMNEATDVGNLERMLGSMETLWNSLSTCLEEMSRKLDSHAVLSLQHAAEAFFLAHALCIPASSSGNGVESNVGGGEMGAPPTTQAASSEPKPAEAAAEAVEELQPSTSAASRPIPRLDHEKYRQNMFTFAEKHRSVLNQILRGNANNLMEDSAMHILTYFPKLLDFDVKRKYFIKEIRRMDSRDRYQREDVAVRIRRAHLFSDSFRELFRLRGADWKQRFYIIFEGEEGQDAGGLLREWYSVITREVFNPMYALFVTSPGDRVTYMINPASYINPEHLDYFKFIGRVIAKAIFDNKQLDCYFTRAFYKHILNVSVRYQDIESEDPSYFKSLEFLLGNPLEVIGSEMTFTVEVEEFGERSIRDLKEGGSKIAVTDENKDEYVQLVCQMKMTGSIRKQLDAFLSGFYDIIPKRLISIFNEQELELLISGLPEIDIDDLCANTEYKGFTRSSTQIQWFWRALRSYEKEDLAKFLQFVTGTSKVPLQGFSQLEGMNGVQKFTIHMDSRSNDRLPSAHTCFNQLDLPCYDSYEQLRRMMLLAIRECSEGFAFA